MSAIEAVRAHLEEMVRGNAALTKVDAQEHDEVIEVYMSWVFDGRCRWVLRRSYTRVELEAPGAVPRLLTEQYREMHSASPERFGRRGRR